MNQRKLEQQQKELANAFKKHIEPILNKHNLKLVSWNSFCNERNEETTVDIYREKQGGPHALQ